MISFKLFTFQKQETNTSNLNEPQHIKVQTAEKMMD